MSRQRDDILQIIKRSEEHLTAEEIFLLCKEEGIPISIATVYRNLGILTEQGIIKKVSVIGEPDRYDKTVTHHEHIYCDRCRRIMDIQIEDLKKLLEEKTGIRLQSYDLCMHYICPECRNKEA